ncbi:MAG: proline racemase family protein [Galactobacter sp.]
MTFPSDEPDATSSVPALETYVCTDYHTGGEPFRIVDALPVEPAGEDVASKRVSAMSSPEIQRIREILCFEPRGHADMYGGFLVDPEPGADLGVLFWHKDGFSTACGHGTIALGAWAVESGRITPDPSGVTDVVIDVPSGRVTARVHTEATRVPTEPAPQATGATEVSSTVGYGPPPRVTHVDFLNVPSYVLAQDVPVTTSRGELTVDVVYGGAIYAHLDAATVGLTITPDNHHELINLGREIKWALNDADVARHPLDDRLSGIYGTILFEDLGPAPAESSAAVYQRNVTIFADGEVDRSPCGSGTSSRVAALTARGTLGERETLLHASIVGSHFTALAVETGSVTLNGVQRTTVTPQVTGTAHLTGRHEFVVDPWDDLVPGFVLR